MSKGIGVDGAATVADLVHLNVSDQLFLPSVPLSNPAILDYLLGPRFRFPLLGPLGYPLEHLEQDLRIGSSNGPWTTMGGSCSAIS